MHYNHSNSGYNPLKKFFIFSIAFLYFCRSFPFKKGERSKNLVFSHSFSNKKKLLVFPGFDKQVAKLSCLSKQAALRPKTNFKKLFIFCTNKFVQRKIKICQTPFKSFFRRALSKKNPLLIFLEEDFSFFK